jgi:hypothetical protein
VNTDHALAFGPPRDVPRREEGPRRVALAILLLLASGSAVALGIFAARAPVWAVFIVWGVLAATATRIAPLAFVAAYALVEPLQAMFIADLPGEARYFDEAVMLGVAVSVLGPVLIARPSLVLKDRPTLIILLFVAWNVASAFINDVPLETAGAGIFVTVDYMILFITVRAMDVDERGARLLGKLIVALGIAASLVAALQHLGVEWATFQWSYFIREDVLRVPSLFEHPNDFGCFMLSPVFLALGYLMANKQKHSVIVCALIATSGLIASFSRSSYLAMFVGLSAGALLGGRRLLKRALIPGIAVAVILGGIMVKAIESRIHKIETEGGDARLTYALQTIPLVRDHPMLGVGPGRFGGEIAQRYSSPVHGQYGVTFNDTWRTIDSFWVHIIAESGIGGGLILLVLFWSIFKKSRRALSMSTDPWVRGMLCSIPMLMAAHIVLNFSTMALEANANAGLLWLILGTSLSAAGERISRSKTAPIATPAPRPVFVE